MFFILSCDYDYETVTKYTLINNSNHNIATNIDPRTSYGDTAIFLILNKGESKSFLYVKSTSKDDQYIIDPLFTRSADTIIICYDDTVCVINKIGYECIEEERCLLNIKSYTGGYTGKLYKFEYEFTEEDYQKALEKFNN